MFVLKEPPAIKRACFLYKGVPFATVVYASYRKFLGFPVLCSCWLRITAFIPNVHIVSRYVQEIWQLPQVAMSDPYMSSGSLDPQYSHAIPQLRGTSLKDQLIFTQSSSTSAGFWMIKRISNLTFLCGNESCPSLVLVFFCHSPFPETL